MTLEDFEKALAAEQISAKGRLEIDEGREHKRRKHHHHHRHHNQYEERESHHGHKRRHRHQDDKDGARHRHHDRRSYSPDSDSLRRRRSLTPSRSEAKLNSGLQRDSWMQAPSVLDVEYVHRKADNEERNASSFVPSKMDVEATRSLVKGISQSPTSDIESNTAHGSVQHDVDYSFGDAGSHWRMTRLKGVYRQAKESGRPVDEVAIERFTDLKAFDGAREEEIELERRETYGQDYVGKLKPSGELYQQRKLDMGIRRERSSIDQAGAPGDGSMKGDVHTDSVAREVPEGAPKPLTDHTDLNKLKAQVMKAKLKGADNAKKLEEEYNQAQARFVSQKDPGTIVLGAMDNRMLAGGRDGAVKAVGTRRGRERGLVEENEEMSIEDMVREERRTRGLAGGSGRQMAERIAKDGKFDNDLDYLDENAAKLAKRVHRSEINLKTAAISDFQKMNRILDSCQLCHKDETNTPPIAPVISLGTRVFLTLPTEPEISDGGACIVPLQHRINLLECDDDEWEEIRNFQKSLIRMYHDQGRDVIFYENAASLQRHKHAAMEVVPLPFELGETAPAFFKEAILTTDEEWTQHKKLIDTLAKAQNGMGKGAFKRSIAKEMPYFHVWFTIDGGLGHIIDDSNRWPRGDLFAREIIGGMLDVGPEVVKRQGRWTKDDRQRADGFRRRWRKFDWTRILSEA